MDRWKSYDLLTHVVRISVGYYAFGTVAVKIEKRYLSPPAPVPGESLACALFRRDNASAQLQMPFYAMWNLTPAINSETIRGNLSCRTLIGPDGRWEVLCWTPGHRNKVFARPDG